MSRLLEMKHNDDDDDDDEDDGGGNNRRLIGIHNKQVSKPNFNEDFLIDNDKI